MKRLIDKRLLFPSENLNLSQYVLHKNPHFACIQNTKGIIYSLIKYLFDKLQKQAMASLQDERKMK